MTPFRLRHDVNVDLFCGIRGWGTDGIGFEIDADACATNGALGATVVRADIATWPLGPLAGQVAGITASPPCQTFSTAGKQDGVAHIDQLCAAIRDYRGGEVDRIDGKTELVLEPLRWTLALRPEWLCCEQVPAVLPLWHATALRLSEHGYSTWCGVLNSADYGVPQTRRRAILIASRCRQVGPPAPTHAEAPGDALFGQLLPWVSMADALGWHGRVGFPRRDDRGDSADGYRERDWRSTDEPSFGLTEKARSWKVRTGGLSSTVGITERSVHRPAPTVAFGHDAWMLTPPATAVNTGRAWKKGGTRADAQTVPVTEPAPTVGVTNGPGNWWVTRPATAVARDARLSPPGWRESPEDYRDGEYHGARSMDDAIKLTVADALTLQSFPPDWPVQGTRTAQFRQVGNAIPPSLARAIRGAVE